MKSIFNHIITLIAMATVCSGVVAQTPGPAEPESNYRRSSLCSFLISRTDQELYPKIQERFLQIETPAQYYNHDLSVRILNVGKKGQYADSIGRWLEDNRVASRLVARWFDRDMVTGDCSMELVKARGLYNATEFDKELASRSIRGRAMLEDAGEELIGRTFVLVHEAHYIDNSKRSKNVATGLRIAGALASAFVGSAVSDLADNLADMTETIKGFRVKFHTRLYQLDWSPEIADEFYNNMYGMDGDLTKAEAFEQGRDKFSLRYIGEVESAGAKTSFMGISEEHPEVMILKACQRAIDDNVADLQKRFEVFRVKSPIKAVEDGKITAAIGMKEGLNEDSEYEVLEAEEKDGRISYHRVGTVKPIPGHIWDNRFMAYEEGAAGSNLAASTFRITSGKNFTTSNFIRQIK